ncbi:MAG: YiaA/YiaB family inner membrane protein [Ahrensia sp.]|nr:YiaA/YiaB family inner membrane protein [Ahrensia sp.]
MSDNNVPYTQKPNSSWTMFTVVSFIIAAGMMAGGIYFLEASFAAKGFYAMSALMLVHTSISITKTMRDNEEANRFINKIEEAKTEKLLKDYTFNGK